jgi:hypothetical protein
MLGRSAGSGPLIVRRINDQRGRHHIDPEALVAITFDRPQLDLMALDFHDVIRGTVIDCVIAHGVRCSGLRYGSQQTRRLRLVEVSEGDCPPYRRE